MASIDLNQFVNKQPKREFISPTTNNRVISKPIYSDLHLDLTQGQTTGQGSNSRGSNDIRADFDDFAIKNSVNNLLNMRAGHKILSPEISTALDQYLFEPVSEDLGRLIGNNIVRTIQTYEPRVTISQCIVRPLPDQNAYSIQVNYNINAKPNTLASISISINNGQISIL